MNLYKLCLNLPYVEYLCTVLIGDVISQTKRPKDHDEIFYTYLYCILFKVVIRGNDGPVQHNIASQTGMPEVKRPKRMTSSYLRRWGKVPFLCVLHFRFTHHSVRILISSCSFFIKTRTPSWCLSSTVAPSAANPSSEITYGPSTHHVSALG